jgi:FkbM family methyltransferase
MTKERIAEIKKDWEEVRKEGRIIREKRLIDLNLGKYKIWVRKCSAYSSLDTYTEIFKYKAHTLLPEFSAEEDSLIIDAGATEGYYTLKIKENNPKCKVIAIEPNPVAFKMLKKNVRANHLRNITFVNKALASRCRKIPFEVVDEIMAIGSTNIRAVKRPWLEESRIKKINVDGITLKMLCQKYNLQNIDILKLDVEESEIEILKNHKNLLKNIKKIVVEYHGEKLRNKVTQLLEKVGYKLLYQDSEVCGDSYFINTRLGQRLLRFKSARVAI